jgi:hypothetical protein
MDYSPLKFDEGTHRYWLDGRPVPSVTQVLAPSRADLLAIPSDILERKRALGVAVHRATELIDLGEELDPDSLDETWLPYIAAWRKFRAEVDFQITHVERKVWHRQMRYAGTLDRFGILEKRWPTVIDVKCSAQLHPSYGPQLAAYARGHAHIEEPDREMEVRYRRFVVQLKPDGTYRMPEYTNPLDWAGFAGLLAFNQWKESIQ